MSETPDTQSLATAPGQILKRARENKNLTVAAIATLMNLDLRTIGVGTRRPGQTAGADLRPRLSAWICTAGGCQ